MIDFLISDPVVHTQIYEPVFRELRQRSGPHTRVVSLCEFQGQWAPTDLFEELHAEILLLSRRFRSAQNFEEQRESSLRNQLDWQIILKQGISRWLERPPALVVMCNDCKFPYNLIVRELYNRSIPFVLLQEDLPFPSPKRPNISCLGEGGATLIAAWGEASAEYFRTKHVVSDRIILTGTPRFDGLARTKWSEEGKKMSARLGLSDNNLVVLSHPIDQEGFCTIQEKNQLLVRLAKELESFMWDDTFRLIFKLHQTEPSTALERELKALPRGKQVIVTHHAPLFPLLWNARAAICLTSSIGLQALLMNVPLGILEIPRFGFVPDYVREGAALGLTWQKPMDSQVDKLFNGSFVTRKKVEDYISFQLSNRGNASARVADLLLEKARNAKTSSITT